MNRYEFNDRGFLLHYINDELRATVPASSLDEYRLEWPDVPSPPVVAAQPVDVEVQP